jgi:YD repeat-containing protein
MTIVVGIPGPQGAPGLSWQNEWSSIVTYTQGEGVSYDGAAYIALSPSLNVVPGTAPLQWSLLVQAPAMVGSNGTVAGSAGSVPAPAADRQGAFLRGDGTWAPGAVSGLTYNGAGQLTGYTEDGIAYELAYNTDGTLNTITGGGSVGTCSYSSGVFTGISYT